MENGSSLRLPDGSVLVSNSVRFRMIIKLLSTNMVHCRYELLVIPFWIAQKLYDAQLNSKISVYSVVKFLFSHFTQLFEHSDILLLFDDKHEMNYLYRPRRCQ